MALHRWQQCFDSARPAPHTEEAFEWALTLHNASQKRLTDRPFKRAVLTLLAQSGGFSQSSSKAHKTLLPLGLKGENFMIQDWTWQRLSVAYATRGLRDEHRYTIKDFAREIVSRGQRFFSPQIERPFLYFQMLLFAQEFEYALDYLAAAKRTTDAVHYAIALYCYGALRIKEPEYETKNQNTLENSTYGLVSPNSVFAFDKLLDGYVKLTSRQRPHRAANYYALLRPTFASSNSGVDTASEKNLRDRYLRHLILDIRQIRLLNDLVGDDMNRTRKSVLTTLLGRPAARACVSDAAREAFDRGESEVSIELYRRIQDYYPMLKVLNSQLATAMHPSHTRQVQIERKARQLARLHFVPGCKQPAKDVILQQLNDGPAVDREIRALLQQLNMLVFFRKAKSATTPQQLSEARSAAREAQLVDLSVNSSSDIIRSHFDNLSGYVRQNYCMFLKEYMTCIGNLHRFVTQQRTQLVSKDGEIDSIMSELQKLRNEAKIIFSFAYNIRGQFTMSMDDIQYLARVEAQIQM